MPINITSHIYAKLIGSRHHPNGHTCMKNVCATLSFQTSCSLQNSADWRKIFSTWA